MAREYIKRYQEKIEDGALEPDTPKRYKDKKRELQYYQAGFITAIIEHRTLPELEESMGFASIYFGTSGISRRYSEGWKQGAVKAAKLGVQIRREIEKEFKKKLIEFHKKERSKK